MKNLKTPYLLKNKLVKNRVVVPPMASQTADINGNVTLKTLNHYKRLTLSKAGIIFVEYSFIDISGKSEINQLGINSDKQIKGLLKINKIIKKSGAISAMQIVHAGGKTFSSISKCNLLAPSKIITPSKDQSYELPKRANHKEIYNLKQQYLNAARRAHIAGFDILELHCAHGYGLNQWLSPITNQRKDKYGGSLENRMRILIEIIQLIKREYPTLILSVRFAAIDFLKGGITPSMGQRMAKILEKMGIELLNVSSGLGGWRRPINFKGEGYLANYAKNIQKVTKIPVIAVGGIKSKGFINNKLKQNWFEFAALGRAILNNPELTKNFKL